MSHDFVVTVIPHVQSPFSLWHIPCKRKLEMNFQISEHELKPVFIGYCVSQVSENGGYYASVLGFHFFLGQKSGILYERSKCDIYDKKI